MAGAFAIGGNLPVFLSDNHAETFGWITRTFDVDARYHLVLVDAHSDASVVERSEEIRENLRRVPDMKTRASRVEEWRSHGRIQAFNWIEPLLPRPIEEVHWFAGLELKPEKRRELTAEATGLLDGRLEVEPRAAGSFGNRWQTIDLAGFTKWDPGTKPVILAVDLDFFAGMAPELRDQVFGKIWKQAMDWPGLAGVAFSVSRPWLKDDAEADALVMLASSAVSRTRGAVMEMDLSVDDRPDDSLKAQEIGGPPPRWDAAFAPRPLKIQWSIMRDRLVITDRKRGEQEITGSRLEEEQLTTIQPDRGEMDMDGVWRFDWKDTPPLRISSVPGATGRVRWSLLEPARAAYDLLPETRLGKEFSASPARWIFEKKRAITVTDDFALSPDQWASGGPGNLRITAEIETTDGWLPTPPISIRLRQGDGFHAALSECFAMPYVFGIATIEDGDLSGVDTGWGSDCSNLLIHAWWKNGIFMPWGDPGRMRAHLSMRAKDITLKDRVSFTPEEFTRGIAIDFRRHVAALWEDREPIGLLGENDLVLHHLGGVPEVVELSRLTKDRPAFSVLLPNPDTPVLKVKAAGDVVLAGEDRVVADGFEKGDADLFIANLEGVPSLLPPDAPPRFDFRFPRERLGWLKEKGLDVVSLANNHAGDAGRAGLLEALENLKTTNLPSVGAGRNEQEACEPWQAVTNGSRVSVFGICTTDSLAATGDQPGVAKLPDHASLLEKNIRLANARGDTVIVMIHGGQEYRSEVTREQKQWARWLTARGASLIIGSHPHVIQRTEMHAGAIIAHSLGNAVYPRTLKGADSGEVRTFEIRSAKRSGPDR